MEYITLSKLINRYPSIGNYVSKVAGSIKLNGLYPKKNFIDFKISPVNDIKLDDIKSIDNTKFQFVLGVKNKSSDTRPFKYFTSPSFFKKLLDSINEPSPYFILQALKKEFIVEYSLEDDIKMLKDLTNLEKEDNVKFKNHLWFLEDGSVDYKKLIQYIDWVVSTPNPLDTTNLGVIPISTILTKTDYEIEKLKLTELPTSAKTVAEGGGSGGSSNSNYNSNSNNSNAFSATVAASIPSSTNTSNGYYNTDTTPATSLPTGTDSSQTGSRNYYYNVRNDSGALVTVYWRKSGIPARLQADYAPGQSGTICAQEGTIDGNITRVQVAGCG